jgi:hypothetical protein
MAVVAIFAGLCALALVLIDAFNTLVLARRTRHPIRIARAYYRLTWPPFAAAARRIPSSQRREDFLGIYRPLSLLLIIAIWAIFLIIGFALLRWGAGMQPSAITPTFGNDLYLSASTLFALATGDPKNPLSKVISTAEGGLSLGFLGLVISYLPVLYESFAKREIEISLLDGKAGSPPSAGALLQSAPSGAEKLERDLETWEAWAAQVLENHLSFPMLAYFRSQHPNQSWLTAMVAITDFAAMPA